MKVAIDLDGVCYEWDKTARYMQRVYRGHSARGPMSREATTWHYIQENVSEEDWQWLWSEGVRLGLFRYGHLVQGAIIGLNDLVNDGHEIIAVTHRPKQAVRDTNAWLSLLDLPWSGIHILSNLQPKSSVEADILVDDKIDNIREWQIETDRPGILFAREWNREAIGNGFFLRVSGWADVVRAVRRKEKWPSR